ncbi:hypothetical protein [Streptomyces sp. NPDC093089]|uniref:hypothetical protein n=1 Tax=Streptomyces sp. NPDC093089 TaxID=3366024 RepID=UPI00380B9D5B
MTVLITVVVVLVVLVLITLAMAVRIVRQYERGVLFRFGRLIGTGEPGLRFLAREATAAATARPAPKPVSAFDLGKPAGVAAPDEVAEAKRFA